MHAANVRTHCGDCRERQPLPAKSSKLGWFSGLLLALLPKCPFCVMAFTSTFVLCGEAGTTTARHTFSSTPTILLTGLFCLISLLSVAFNFRKEKTPVALFTVAVGSLAVMISASFDGGLALYYTGTCIMFVGVWYNGSLMHFLAKLKWRLHHDTLPKRSL